MPPFAITAFYKFFALQTEHLPTLHALLEREGQRLAMGGLILVAPEGINGTIAGSHEHIAMFKEILVEHVGSIDFKDSEAHTKPFKRFSVKIKREIVAIGDPQLHPVGDDNGYLQPDEWDTMLAQDDVVVLDTRNDYETEIGMFTGAIDPQIKTFQEFPAFVQSGRIPKDKKVMMYCTGGIRCEKAALEMRRQGYQHVYQLHGGILKYLEEKPQGSFQGECFVFDHRVAVNQELKPSVTYALCPHCGDPGDVRIPCSRCDRPAVICKRCNEHAQLRTCTKDCAHHVQRRLGVRTQHAGA